MNVSTLSAVFLALFWGITYALFLQFTTLGRWLCNRRTYMTVVIGIGVDLLILALVIPLETLTTVTFIIALSSIGIIARSIYNELAEHRELERINAHAASSDERDQRN